MRIFILALLLITIGGNCATAQSPAINHIALYVFDLKKSAAFYKDVMQLKEIDEPFKDGKHLWLRIGKHSQLHIIQGATAIKEHDINSHIAFNVKSLQKFIAVLEKQKIKYGNSKGELKMQTVRPDGVKQVYLQDPDNFWIEVNDDRF
ncbi:MAG TPA: VOC family protein [Segetibacter sp.]|jgi:lactoylglutathione lyase